MAKYNIFKNAEHKLITYELKNNKNLEKVNDLIYFGLDWKYNYKNKVFYNLDKEIIKDENIALHWEHNKKNISGILWIIDIINPNSDKEKIQEVLSSFTWLAHRQENIWIYRWVTFINDSIATTPESTIAAIKTFWNNIDTIFVWNEDSWFDLTELRKTLEKYEISNIVLFPTTWEKIFGDFSKNMDFDLEYIYEKWNYKVKLFKTLSMDSAVNFAYNNTISGKIVLLSTWAPSFNAKSLWVMPWKSYVEKWNMFKKAVLKYFK